MDVNAAVTSPEKVRSENALVTTGGWIVASGGCDVVASSLCSTALAEDVTHLRMAKTDRAVEKSVK
jgi:hypothetical protein